MPKSLQIRQAIAEAKRNIRVRTERTLRRLAKEERTRRAYAYIRSLNPPPEVPEEKIQNTFCFCRNSDGNYLPRDVKQFEIKQLKKNN